MSVQHWCGKKWAKGPLADCPKHNHKTKNPPKPGNIPHSPNTKKDT